MTTYLSYHDHQFEIENFNVNKILHVLFAGLFIMATYIVPSIAAIIFLFF